MGGAQAGEVASRIAVEAFQRELARVGSPEERLADRAQDANRRIYEISRSEHERAGMGTTLTAVYLDETAIAVAHVGDSRAYLFRDGELSRLTQDHSLVEELVRRGKLTEEQAAEHPQRSIITRALGVDPQVEVDTWTYPARAGDVVLLCSDGLTSMITEEQIAAVLGEETDLDRAGERLIEEANAAGGRDNITVVMFRLEEVGGAPTARRAADDGRAAPMPADGHDAAARASAGEPATSAAARTATLTAPPRAAAARRRRANRAAAARRSAAGSHPGPAAPPAGPAARGPRRFAKPLAALMAVVIVLFLVGGGGYLATRQLFFVGTDSQGIVTIYRAFPTTCRSGSASTSSSTSPASRLQFVPAARRKQLLNHQLRSQADAISLVHAAELGQLSR